MSKNSQILEAVGGLEAAQGIVDRAPFAADYVMRHMINIYYRQISQFNVAAWCPARKRWDSPQKYSLVENWCFKLSDLRTAITEQRVAESNQSVALAKEALSTFSYEPKYKVISTHAELVLREQIKDLNSSRNFWRVMFFAVFVGYGVAWWLV